MPPVSSIPPVPLISPLLLSTNLSFFKLKSKSVDAHPVPDRQRTESTDSVHGWAQHVRNDM